MVNQPSRQWFEKKNIDKKGGSKAPTAGRMHRL